MEIWLALSCRRLVGCCATFSGLQGSADPTLDGRQVVPQTPTGSTWRIYAFKTGNPVLSYMGLQLPNGTITAHNRQSRKAELDQAARSATSSRGDARAVH